VIQTAGEVNEDYGGANCYSMVGGIRLPFDRLFITKILWVGELAGPLCQL